MAVSFSRTARALEADRGTGARVALWVAMALLAVWAMWFFLGRVSVFEVSRTARIEVASSSRQIATEQGGRLVASGLHIGRVVRAGEVLAELDSEPQKLRLAEAEARLAGYPARMAALRRELAASEAARAGSEHAADAAIAAARARARGAAADAAFTNEMARKQRLDSEAGGIAPVEAERSSTEARKSAAARDALALDQGRTAGDARATSAERTAVAAGVASALAATASEWAAAEALVKQLRHELDVRRIRAPADGVIGDVTPLRPGELVPPGTRLATLVPQGDLRIVATFGAARGLGRLSPGQSARLRLDGFAWTQYGDFPARVERVAAESIGDDLRVELRMPRRRHEELPLRHGMTGQVDIMVEDVSPAVMILRALGQVWA